MQKLSYNQKARCQGCSALQAAPGTYSCALGLPIKFVLVEGTATQPAPDNVKCYKPKSPTQLNAVREAQAKNNA